MTDLTEQWKKGELKPGLYYGADFVGFTHFYMFDGWTMRYLTGMPATNIEKILVIVPSYKELQSMNDAVNQAMAANIKLVEQNAQLKELLKECKEIFDECFSPSAKHGELYKKIDEALK